MKLAQAVEASQEQGAYRIVGALRILLRFGNQELRVLVQRRDRRHWMLTDSGGGVRYLNGVRRDEDGSWVINRCDHAVLGIVAHCLPQEYQHLLAPESDDWQMLGGKKQEESCRLYLLFAASKDQPESLWRTEECMMEAGKHVSPYTAPFIISHSG